MNTSSSGQQSKYGACSRRPCPERPWPLYSSLRLGFVCLFCFILFLSVFMCEGTEHMHGGQFSPSCMWVPGIK